MAVLEEIPDEADAGAAAPDACGGAAPCAAEERSGDAAPPVDADADAASGEAGADAEPEFHDAHETEAELAESYKKQGNECFGRGAWEDAEALYSSALEVAPPEAPARAVYYSNRAAARLSMGHFAEAAEDCTAALQVDEGYVKALVRRAQAYEKQGELEQLEKAFTDYTRVLELEPGHKAAEARLKALQPVLDAKREALKAEMMDTLKGFGNTILGKFGFSLDNFKAEQDPATGSYSIQFVNGGGAAAPGGEEAEAPAALGGVAP